jgi:S1-C subfamily serine protease
VTFPSATPQRLSTVILAAGALLVASCGTDAPDVAPEERAVSLRTTACGDASRTRGSGVVVGDGTVLTAAHVVVGADEVFVAGETGSGSSLLGDGGAPEDVEVHARVVLLDLTRDLAVLEVSTSDADPIDLGQAEDGDVVRVVGGASSGTVEATVERRVSMEVDDVRSQSRSRRSGYELDVAIAGGDSGAGVYDADGRLVGIVFATPTQRSGASFAVGAAEIEAVLGAPDHTVHRCDAAESRVVPSAED